MFDITKDYNRRYYRNVAIIWIVVYWKLFRLSIAKYLIKLAFVISSDAKKAIESRLK